MTILPATVKESGSVVTDLVQNIVMVNSGTIYAVGDTGNFYKRTTSGVWSSEADLSNGTFGLSYRSDVDKLFIPSPTTVSEYSPISSSPTIKVDKFAESVSTDTGATLTGGTTTKTLGTSILETATEKQEFTSDIEPLSSVKVRIGTKGTGNWTLTVHDELNTVLATSTIVNASLTSGTQNEFTFSPTRIYVKPNARTYHFHLTSTVADGTVVCATAGDLNTCDFEIYADRLISTNNGMHPMQTFLQYECIGNGNYLSVWEPLSETPSNSEWQRHRLVFPAGLEVCGLAVWNEYLAIACENKTVSGNAQDGYIFLWDGVAKTYNFFLRIPEGSPYGMHEYKNVLYYFAGGAWFAYAGGTPIKIRTMPNTDSEYSGVADTTTIYPYTATVRRGVHLFAFPSSTTNTAIEHGIYSYGSVDKNFNDSFGYSYTASTGTVTNTSGNFKIGMAKNFGDTLFMSWQDGTAYGVDAVNNLSAPYTTATWESLEYYDKVPSKDKLALEVVIGCEDLPTGATLTPKYKINGGSWVLGDVVSSGYSATLAINARFKKIQVGIELTATTTTPVVSSVVLYYDDLMKEAFS